MTIMDKKSVNTNVPFENVLRKHSNTKTNLSLWITEIKFKKIIYSLINIKFDFIFNKKNYKLKFGLSMGSPLSGVMA